jgi:small subunit ribosomal protein S19
MAEFYYRGKTVEELKKLNDEDLKKIVNADLRRVLRRGFSPEEKKLIAKLRKNPKEAKTHSREMFIMPEFVGKTVKVYNGKEFISLEVKPEMVFHRLGEFILTTKQVRHGTPGMRATRSSEFVPIK